LLNEKLNKSKKYFTSQTLHKMEAFTVSLGYDDEYEDILIEYYEWKENEHINDLSYEEQLKEIHRNPSLLKFIKNQTEDMCLLAVSRSCYVLGYVHNQTDEICMTAVEHNGIVLEDVENQTDEICYAAVLSNENAIQYIRDEDMRKRIESFFGNN